MLEKILSEKTVVEQFVVQIFGPRRFPRFFCVREREIRETAQTHTASPSAFRGEDRTRRRSVDGKKVSFSTPKSDS